MAGAAPWTRRSPSRRVEQGERTGPTPVDWSAPNFSPDPARATSHCPCHRAVRCWARNCPARAAADSPRNPDPMTTSSPSPCDGWLLTRRPPTPVRRAEFPGAAPLVGRLRDRRDHEAPARRLSVHLQIGPAPTPRRSRGRGVGAPCLRDQRGQQRSAYATVDTARRAAPRRSGRIRRAGVRGGPSWAVWVTSRWSARPGTVRALCRARITGWPLRPSPTSRPSPRCRPAGSRSWWPGSPASAWKFPRPSWRPSPTPASRSGRRVRTS